MKTKILCKIFGHKLGYFSLMPHQLICKRCGFETKREDENGI